MVAEHSVTHERWQGDDAPDECVRCQEPWPCMDAYLTERERADQLAHALNAVANAALTPVTITVLADMRAEGRVR